MNIVITICNNSYPDYKYHHFSCLLKIQHKSIDSDEILLTQCGLQCINVWDYNVIDESKFAVFMLKYPEYIEKISYE